MAQHILSEAFICPECNEQLVSASGKPEFKPGDVLICPIHGPIGTLGEIQKEAAEFAAGQIGEAVTQIFEASGFDISEE